MKREPIPIKLRRSTLAGSRPDARDMPGNFLAINVPDRLIYYKVDGGQSQKWDARMMPEDLWRVLTEGFNQ